MNELSPVEVISNEEPHFSVRQRLMLKTILQHPTYDIDKIFKTLKVKGQEREKYLMDYYQPVFQDKLVMLAESSESIIKRAAPEAAKTLVKLMKHKNVNARFESSREILKQEHIIKHGDTPILNIVNMPTIIFRNQNGNK